MSITDAITKKIIDEIDLTPFKSDIEKAVKGFFSSESFADDLFEAFSDENIASEIAEKIGKKLKKEIGSKIEISLKA